MKLILAIGLWISTSFVIAADESVGFQRVECGGKIFLITSINTFAAMELKDTKNQAHELRSYGLGQGGASEWACIPFDSFYLVFRGNTLQRISEVEAVDLNVHDVFDTVQERFVQTGDIGKYVDLLENHKANSARKLYPKLDAIYRRARFRKFNFELPDQLLVMS